MSQVDVIINGQDSFGVYVGERKEAIVETISANTHNLGKHKEQGVQKLFQ